MDNRHNMKNHSLFADSISIKHWYFSSNSEDPRIELSINYVFHIDEGFVWGNDVSRFVYHIPKYMQRYLELSYNDDVRILWEDVPKYMRRYIDNI